MCCGKNNLTKRVFFTQHRITRLIKILYENKLHDPKYALILELLNKQGFKDKGCIIFTQYFDPVHWLAENLSNELNDLTIGLYADGDKSKVFLNGKKYNETKEDIKAIVKSREIKNLMDTDAASEGLNLQALGTLINHDLPWNLTRIEQRKESYPTHWPAK